MNKLLLCAARNEWQDHGLVFASEFGTPVDPRNILRTIQIAAQRAGMSDIGVHTLPHSAAVAWVESGDHPVHIRRRRRRT